MKITAEGGELTLSNEKGDIAIIPKSYRNKVLKYIEEGNSKAIDDLVSSLPSMEDYAEDGTLINNEPIDPPVKKSPPIKQKLNEANSFMKDWFSNPVTKEKVETIAPGLSDKIMSELERAVIVDMDQLKDDGVYKNMQSDLIDNMGVTNKQTKLQALKMLKAKSHDSGIQGTAQAFKDTNWIGVKRSSIAHPNETIIHEATHNKQQYNLESQLSKWENKKLSNDEAIKVAKEMTKGKNILNLEDVVRQNRDNIEGVYPRIMETRSLLNAKPGVPITKDQLNSSELNYMGSPIQGLRMNYDDDTIIEILNSVAQNTIEEGENRIG